MAHHASPRYAIPFLFKNNRLRPGYGGGEVPRLVAVEGAVDIDGRYVISSFS